jgi:hypothetical protein
MSDVGGGRDGGRDGGREAKQGEPIRAPRSEGNTGAGPAGAAWVMRAPTRGLAKALRSIYWGGGGGPALPPARGVRSASGVYKTRQDKGN